MLYKEGLERGLNRIDLLLFTIDCLRMSRCDSGGTYDVDDEIKAQSKIRSGDRSVVSGLKLDSLHLLV